MKALTEELERVKAERNSLYETQSDAQTLEEEKDGLQRRLTSLGEEKEELQEIINVLRQEKQQLQAELEERMELVCLIC